MKSTFEQIDGVPVQMTTAGLIAVAPLLRALGLDHNHVRGVCKDLEVNLLGPREVKGPVPGKAARYMYLVEPEDAKKIIASAAPVQPEHIQPELPIVPGPLPEEEQLRKIMERQGYTGDII